MRVVKVLNNSLVLALDDCGRETILMGKGIGYRRSIGYMFRDDEIEKVFQLKDRDISRSIIRLAAETDSVYFEIAKAVIDHAIGDYGMKLMDHIYLSLTDHLAFAARRVQEEILVPNFYTLEMRKFNPAEFEIGEYALKLVNDQLGIELPMDEAGNIAFHFINAQYDHPYNSKNLKIANTVKDILDIVKYNFGIVYNEESTVYARYVTHVQLFVQRLVSRTLLPEEKSPFLYEQIASVCRVELACADKIQVYVKEQYHQVLTNQERMYLALHIHKILEEDG